MAKKNNKTCIVCGKKYTYCNTCGEYRHLPIFMVTFCGQNCLDVYNVLSGYEGGEIDKNTAKNKLESLDTSRHMYYSGSFKKTFNKIMDIVEEGSKESAVEEESTLESEGDVSSISVDSEITKDLAKETASKVVENNTASSDEIADQVVKNSHSKTFMKNKNKNRR